MTIQKDRIEAIVNDSSLTSYRKIWEIRNLLNEIPAEDADPNTVYRVRVNDMTTIGWRGISGDTDTCNRWAVKTSPTAMSWAKDDKVTILGIAEGTTTAAVKVGDVFDSIEDAASAGIPLGSRLRDSDGDVGTLISVDATFHGLELSGNAVWSNQFAPFTIVSLPDEK